MSAAAARRADGSRWEFTDAAQSPVAAGCSCQPCAVLRAKYAADQKLLLHLGKRLLVRGWAGSSPTPAEQAYIRAHATWGQANAGAAALQRARQRPVLPPWRHSFSDGGPTKHGLVLLPVTAAGAEAAYAWPAVEIGGCTGQRPDSAGEEAA